MGNVGFRGFSGKDAVLANMPPGYEIDYVEFTAVVNITATSEATADTVVTANPVAFDGASLVEINFFSPYARPQATTNASLSFYLYDGTVSVGYLGYSTVTAATSDYKPIYLSRRFAPSNGVHTFSIRCSTSSGTGEVVGGLGGVTANMPGYIRIRKV